MRASSQGNPYHDERGRFASANSHSAKVLNTEEHYFKKTEQRKKEIDEFRRKASQQPSKNFKDNKVTKLESFSLKRMSKHVRFDRKERTELSQKLIESENASVINNFLITHPKGDEEVHILYSNGVIKVANVNGTWVTTLIAKPYQIKRYYRAIGEEAPQSTLNYAIEHTIKEYFLVK